MTTFEDDFQDAWDDLADQLGEAVTLRKTTGRRRDSTGTMTAGNEVDTTITKAFRRRAVKEDKADRGGRLSIDEVLFDLPADELGDVEPKAGDLVIANAGAETWHVLSARKTGAGSWEARARK